MRKKTLLSTIIDEISMGPFGSDIKVDNFISSGIPVLNGSNLTNKKLVEDSFNFISKTKADSLKKANAKRGDIVITHRGTLGQVSYIPINSKYERYVISQSQFRIRFNKEVNPIYLTYLFHTDYGQKKLLSFKNHVGVPALAQATSNFKLLELLIHDKVQQDKIAAVLTSIDNKIELNNKINLELEVTAKTVYDYWFVQFDFPDEYGRPYKSTGGKMIFCKQLKRNIPEYWDTNGLESIGTISGGSTPSSQNATLFSTNGIAWITPKDLSLNIGKKYISKGERDISEDGRKSASLTIMPPGTVLMSSRAPIGYLSIARNDVTTNQGFKSFIPKSYFTTEYIYYTIQYLLPVIKSKSSGSTFQEVSGTVLKAISIPIAPKHLIEKFRETVGPILKKQELLEQENEQIVQLRNWLLPMLMNGQVSVGDATAQVNEAFNPVPGVTAIIN